MNPEELQDKSYIGDGVYCGHDGYQIWLWTSDGLSEKNFIALDSSVFDALVKYRAQLSAKQEELLREI